MSENAKLNEQTSLSLTAHCFQILLDAITERFLMQHREVANMGVGQLFGFGNYNENLPNLKNELQRHSATFINGKYLYDKKRELNSGIPFIKITRPYKYLLFDYLGYKDVLEFMQDHITDEAERTKQLGLITTQNNVQAYYYVSYHFGEYREIVKAQVITKDDWKNVIYKYIYPQSDGSIKEFTYLGTIKKRADALHIQTKTLMDGKMVEGGETILYIGYGDPAKSKFILGVYTAFDINNRLIAGKLIYEKCTTEEEMIMRSLDKSVPAYIVQEIRNQRIENDISIPNDKLEISQNSPYYTTYEKISGRYKFSFFDRDDEVGELEIRIDPQTYKIKPSNSGILINKDDIQLLQNGSVLHMSFAMTGLSSFVQVQIYVKTYYLRSSVEKIKGVYCGIDLENRLRNGEVIIDYNP